MKPLRLLACSPLALLLCAGAAQACPDWSGQGQLLTYDSAQLTMGQTTPVVAGGNIDLTTCPIPGGANGFVIANPDFDLTVTDNLDGMALIATVEAECDTVLLINDANGTWHFNDDANESLQPMIIVGDAPVGVYDIWVGTYGTATCNAALTLAFEGGEGDEGGKDDAGAPPEAPLNMMEFRGQTGAVYDFMVTANGAGAVWGSGVYTDDSAIATAAVHAGVLAEGETGMVMIAVVGGQPSYPGSVSNGVASADYGQWEGSYQFLDEMGNPVTVEVAPAGGASK